MTFKLTEVQQVAQIDTGMKQQSQYLDFGLRSKPL